MATIRELGYYVYTLADPETGEVKYVGKGSGRRCLHHFKCDGNSKKAKWMRELRRRGLTPKLEILVHGLDDQETAFRVEAAAIDLLGLENLVNEIKGWNSEKVGRAELSKLISMYDRKKVKIKDPVALIRINQLFRYDMSPVDLYDATRGFWRLGKKREKAIYAFSIFKGVVQEVYEVLEWFPAGSTFSSRDGNRPNRRRNPKREERWEFVGQIAPDAIRKKYVGKDVSEYLKYGNRSPVVYVNC